MRARTFQGGARLIFQFVWLVLLLQLLPFTCHRPKLGQKITGKRGWHEHHPRHVPKPDLDKRGVGGRKRKILGAQPDAGRLLLEPYVYFYAVGGLHNAANCCAAYYNLAKSPTPANCESTTSGRIHNLKRIAIQELQWGELLSTTRPSKRSQYSKKIDTHN